VSTDCQHVFKNIVDNQSAPFYIAFTMKYAKFAKAIKSAMKQEGLSLRALSRETGIDVSFLSKILRGDRNPPPNSYIIKIAKVLNLNPDQLIFDAGRIPKHAINLFRGVLDVMKPIISSFEGKEQDLLLSGLDFFFNTEEGKQWFLDDYEKYKSIPRTNQDMENSFAARAFRHFVETPEGMRWLENEIKKLNLPEPDLRPLYESINKRPT
jgi:transcriptional regulator with XRE-family HTH domain